MQDWRFRGYVEHALAAVEEAEQRTPPELTDAEHTFLTDGFKDAADRMTTLASAVGTSGSFVLVLVALLVGFASTTNQQTDRLLAASNAETQLAEGCSGKDASGACDVTKLRLAHAEVQRARDRLDALADLNRAQAITGALVVVAFLLGLAALLTNPVPGVDGKGRDKTAVAAWRKAVDRLKTKRRWIQASLAVQCAAILSIAYIGADVFS